MNLDDLIMTLAADLNAPIDLAEAALLLAQEERPELQIGLYLSRLDDYAEILKPRLHGSLEGKVTELSHFLFEELGFTGNATNYYDAENSYFDSVLDRKLGIPITLTLVAMAVGERAGLSIHGVGLPGPFIAKATDDHDEILFDPFHGGGMLDHAACNLLVSSILGQQIALTTEQFEPVPPGLFLLRMLNNLKGIYLRQSDFARGARVIRRLARLNPSDDLQQRDLGVCLVRAGAYEDAIEPLQAYLSLREQGDDLDAVREILNRALQEVARWN